MADYVKSTYVEFWTTSHFEELAEKNYSDEKFESMYAVHPSRMTPEQIKGIGYDMVRSRLWSDWIDKKYNSLNEIRLAVSNSVIDQFKTAIEKKYPKLKLKVWEGEVKKYGDNKFRATRIIIKDDLDRECMCIIPTLSDRDNCYFTIKYWLDDIEDWNNVTRDMNDVQAMGEIDKLNLFITTGEVPNFGVNKVKLCYENQYEVTSGEQKLKMHDTKMILFYHCIAKEMNKNFGTDFKWSQKVIDSLYKHHEFTNINYLGYFDLRYCKDNSANVHEVYYYEDDKTKKPTFECAATYGYWSKEELINMLNVLYPYIHSSYFYDTSKKSMEDKYNAYDRMHIGYRERPNYFDLLLWNEE